MYACCHHADAAVCRLAAPTHTIVPRDGRVVRRDREVVVSLPPSLADAAYIPSASTCHTPAAAADGRLAAPTHANVLGSPGKEKTGTWVSIERRHGWGSSLPPAGPSNTGRPAETLSFEQRLRASCSFHPVIIMKKVSFRHEKLNSSSLFSLLFTFQITQ